MIIFFMFRKMFSMWILGRSMGSILSTLACALVLGWSFSIFLFLLPMDPSTKIIKQILQQPSTSLTKDPHIHITNKYTSRVLPEKTYFLFQAKYYEHVYGAALGSPIVPLLQTCLWKSTKSRSLALPHLPSMAKVC